MAKPSLFEVIKSVLAAFIGIQSDKNRRQDFEHGSPTAYIFAGLVFTLVFVLVIVLIVSKVVGD